MIDAMAVIKQACDIAGITAPENLTDELYAGAVAQDLYNHQARAALAVHPFSFAQDLVQLSRLSEAPLVGYRYCHQIPTEDLIIGVDRLYARVKKRRAGCQERGRGDLLPQDRICALGVSLHRCRRQLHFPADFDPVATSV